MTYRRIAARKTADDFRAYVAALGVTLNIRATPPAGRLFDAKHADGDNRAKGRV